MELFNIFWDMFDYFDLSPKILSIFYVVVAQNI